MIFQFLLLQACVCHFKEKYIFFWSEGVTNLFMKRKKQAPAELEDDATHKQDPGDLALKAIPLSS